MLNITPPAQKYLLDLLAKQEAPKTFVRVYVTYPGTPRAETCLVYCKPGEETATDESRYFGELKVFIDKLSEPYLKDAEVDFKKNDMGGQLTIKAPNARLSHIDENSSITEQINYYLYSEINPGLAAHGGMVSLVEITENDSIAVLRFGGGCQGCGMVDLTLKEGVEKTLTEKIPQLKGVRDVTDHEDRSQAYY